MNNIISVTPKEAKNLIKFFVKRNQQLEKEGKLKNAVNLVSEAGIGKTSIVEQIAEEMGMVYQKLMLSTSDELGDLVGFPMKQYELRKSGKGNRWVNEKEYRIYMNNSWVPTGHVRTAYAPPSWVQAFKGHEETGGILNIDDAFRCLPHFNQAIMSLIDRGEYYDWKLPENVHIVLTNNPDDGEYFVQAQDQAQATRYFTYTVKFSSKDWAEYAENVGIDGRCINFMLKYHDQILPADSDASNKEGKLRSNPRQWTKFFNAIGGISNFNTPDNISLIQNIGQGIVGDQVASFTHFINNRLDELIEPKRMLFDKDFKAVIREMKSVVGDLEKNDGTYNAAISNILMTRFTNYLVKHVNDNPLTDELCDRVENIVKAKVFGEDHNYKMFRDACKANHKKFVKLTTRDFFIESVM